MLRPARLLHLFFFFKLFTGLQPPDFADVCLLATGQLGLYPDRTSTG